MKYKKEFRCFLFFLVLASAISCSQNKSELMKLLSAPDVIARDSIKLKFSGQLEIPINTLDNTSGLFLRPYIYQGRYLYGITQSKPNNYLSCIDIESQIFVYKIELNDIDIKTEGISTFFVHSGDSIFFQLANSAKIVLIDSLGDVINKYETSLDHKFIFASFLPQYVANYNEKTKNFYSTLVPVGFFGSLGNNYDQVQFQGIFNLNSNKWVQFYGPLEGVMKEKKDGFYPPDLSVPYSLIHNGKAYINYPMDHYIYVYDLNSGDLLFKEQAVDKTKINLTEPISDKLLGNRQEIWNFRIKCGFYEPLFFHSKVKLFTRAIHFPQELKTNDGRLNSGEDRQTAVIILNERLEFVGDTIFNNGQYPIHSAIPLPDGLLLFSKDKDVKNTLPNRKYILKNLQ